MNMATQEQIEISDRNNTCLKCGGIRDKAGDRWCRCCEMSYREMQNLWATQEAEE